MIYAATIFTTRRTMGTLKVVSCPNDDSSGQILFVLFRVVFE